MAEHREKCQLEIQSAINTSKILKLELDDYKMMYNAKVRELKEIQLE